MTISPLSSKESGTAMLFVLVLSVICGILMASISFSSRVTTKKSGEQRGNVALFNIVEAGKEDGIAKIRSKVFNPSPGTRLAITSVNNFSGGSYAVSCSANSSLDTVSIISTGTLGTKSKAVEVIAKVGTDAWRGWIRGAVTARTDITTLGSIEIDGRDYDTTSIFGTLLGTGGVIGVSAGGAVVAGGSSTIGGNSTSPRQPALPGVTVQPNADTAGYPTTPEEVLGVPPGSLDAYKCSTCPPANFYGIVYTDKECDFAGGILICHNASGTASLGNYHGHHKGLIIADEVKHFNAGSSVLGAVFMLGKTPGGNCFGNGAARIHYSSRMLEKVMKTLPVTGLRDVTVISWREIN